MAACPLHRRECISGYHFEVIGEHRFNGQRRGSHQINLSLEYR